MWEETGAVSANLCSHSASIQTSHRMFVRPESNTGHWSFFWRGEGGKKEEREWRPEREREIKKNPK